MKLYHASDTVIEKPDVYHSREHLDFGKGFYLTSIHIQAENTPNASCCEANVLLSMNICWMKTCPAMSSKYLEVTMKSGWTMLVNAVRDLIK